MLEYEQMVSVTNNNHDDSVIKAKSMGEALAQMSIGYCLPVDKHFENRLKTTFKV